MSVYRIFVLWAIVGASYSPLEAQRSGRSVGGMEAGVRFGRDFSVDSWTAGGHLRIPILRTVDIRPSGDLALDNLGDDFQLNADLALHGPRDMAYVGAGLGYVNRDFGSGKDSGTGLNLFLGFKPLPRPGPQISLEGRWTLVESETIFRVALGVTFPL